MAISIKWERNNTITVKKVYQAQLRKETSSLKLIVFFPS